MLTFRQKAFELCRIAVIIEEEDFFNDVTLEEQKQLEEIVCTIKRIALALKTMQNPL
jgi:hypothetical protein